MAVSSIRKDNYSLNNFVLKPCHGLGTILPHSWYHKILSSRGKPDFICMTLLAELLNWHEVNKGKEFDEGYRYFESRFNLSRCQVRSAFIRLASNGLVTRSFRTLVINNRKFPNELHLKLNLEKIAELNPGYESANCSKQLEHSTAIVSLGSIAANLDNLSELEKESVSSSSTGRVLDKTETEQSEHKQSEQANFNKLNNSKSKSLADFYPLELFDIRILQNKSGCNFEADFINQLLKRLSTKYLEHKFPSKAAFLSYMSKLLKSEVNTCSYNGPPDISDTGVRSLTEVTGQFLKVLPTPSSTCIERTDNTMTTDDLALEDGSIWSGIRAKLIKAYGVAVNKHWFSKLKSIEDGNKLTLVTPSPFNRDYLQQNYGHAIEQLCNKQNYQLVAIMEAR